MTTRLFRFGFTRCPCPVDTAFTRVFVTSKSNLLCQAGYFVSACLYSSCLCGVFEMQCPLN